MQVMTKGVLRSAALALLLGSSAMASAQGQPIAPAGSQAQPQLEAQPKVVDQKSVAPDHTIPAPGGASQPQSPGADNMAPAAIGPSQDNTAAAVPHPTVPGATRTTMPSTISAENAAQDKRPVLSFQFPLNEAQRKFISTTVGKMPNASPATKAEVATLLPENAALLSFPAEVVAQIPRASRYKYVRTAETVMVVDPASRVVIDTIAN